MAARDTAGLKCPPLSPKKSRRSHKARLRAWAPTAPWLALQGQHQSRAAQAENRCWIIPTFPEVPGGGGKVMRGEAGKGGQPNSCPTPRSRMTQRKNMMEKHLSTPCRPPQSCIQPFRAVATEHSKIPGFKCIAQERYPGLPVKVTRP